MTITTKQKGDACEMLVVAELTLAGMPACKMPDKWPDYDIIAHPPAEIPQRISVKARSFAIRSQYVEFTDGSDFDWLAVVILMPEPVDKDTSRDIYVIPRMEFEKRSVKTSSWANQANWRSRIDRMHEIFPEFKDNFGLLISGAQDR